MTTFYVWKHYTQGNTNAQTWHQRRIEHNADSLVLKLQIWALGRQLKAQLFQDKQDHLSRLADEAARSSATQIYAKLRALGVCGKRKRRAITPLPMVHHDDPQVDSQDIWRQHFERLEDGIECDPAALLADCDRIQRERPTILPVVGELPTLLELEHAFRANSRGKACFFDGVPTELAHHFPQSLASHFFPLLLKQALLIAEPITFKGGLLVQAFKGHGPMNACESYRSLMVSSIFSKSGHRILRRQAVKHMQTYKAAAQLGGLPGKAVSQAAHILTTWANWKKKEHRSTAVIFVDVRQAFYRLLRAHLTKPEHLDDDVVRLFHTLQLPADSFQDFATELHNAQALRQSGMSEYLEAHLVEVLHGTWFALPGDCRISKTRKGTRPGDNLADLLFSFVFARLLKRVIENLREDDITFTVHGCCKPHPYPWQLDVQATATFELLGPTWADDLAVMVDADTPAELVHRTRRIGSEIFDQFAISGMDVNFGHSKTEIVMTELFRHNPACLDIDTRLLGAVHVRLVNSYRHLGTLFATGGRLAPEIRQRIGHAKSEFRRHRKAIYGQSKLTCQRRVQLFKTLVLTSLMYNIAVWPPLTKQEHTQFVNGLLSLYSSLAYAIFGPEAFTWRDERILSRLGLPSPNEVFHMARLRYLQHIILQGDSVIWTVLQLESSWLSLIDQDLAWLRGQAPWRVPQTDPRDSWDSWNVLIRTGGQWKNLVNKAGVHAQLQRRRQSDWYDWHRAFLDMLSAHQLWQDTRSTDMQGIHACLKCRKRFSTKAAWSVHAFKIHSRLTPARKFADGVECKVCMRRYGSHDRLVNHLKYSVKCQREHRRRQLFVTPQPSVNSAALRRQQTDGVLPILPVHGPQHEPAPPEPYDWTDGLGPAEQACVDELVDLYEQLAKEPINTVDAITVVHTIFNRSWTYAPRLINLFCISMDDYIRVELATGTNEDDVFIAALKELREGVCAVWSAEWLLSDIVDTRYTTKTGHGTLDPEVELVRLCSQPTERRADRPLSLKQFIFIHLFSGHRREGDLQQAIEGLGGNTTEVMALSVDVVISESFGNLLDPAILSLFMRAI